MNPSPRLRRTFLWLTTGTLAVFAALLCTLTLVLRARLREEVLQREANAIHAVARMEINTAAARLARLNVPVSGDDVFAAVLESSRLSGVLAVQLFDASGTLRDALPAVAADAVAQQAWWPQPLAAPWSLFHPRGSLEEVFDIAPEPGADVTRTPLLEVAVPLGREPGSGELGVARYWIDAGAIREEFRRMDQRLALQSGLTLAGGGALVLLLMGWTYRRLRQANEQLLAQSEDLARANQELDFAAKTGALGAISAHLIHGLKNPLAGLEGFVADAATAPDGVGRGEAQQTAMETARRLRAMVNDVVTVLRDEAAGSADYRVPVREALEGVARRTEPIARAAGVELVIAPDAEGELNARTANLAGLVLANLLGNAIEASPPGGTVRLEATAGAGRIHFLVTDTGAGIPATVRNSLFRPVLSTKPGGGGMGLAISHRLARHAGGELSLVQSDGSGTVFRVTVPAAA